MKKIFIILSLVIPFHTSQALGVGDILDWVKPLWPWQENEPSLTFELTDTTGNIYTQENTRDLVYTLFKRNSGIRRIL